MICPIKIFFAREVKCKIDHILNLKSDIMLEICIHYAKSARSHFCSKHPNQA